MKMCIKPPTGAEVMSSRNFSQVQNFKARSSARYMPKKPYARPSKSLYETPKVTTLPTTGGGLKFVIQDDDDDDANPPQTVLEEFKKEPVEEESVLGGGVEVVTKEVPTPIKKQAVNNTGAAAFVKILIHALACSACTEVSCKKMTMVLKHYQQCRIKRTTEGSLASTQCKLCQQLLRIVAHHSKFLCNIPADKPGCPVLMCDTLRMASAMRQGNLRQNRVVVRRNGITQAV